MYLPPPQVLFFSSSSPLVQPLRIQPGQQSDLPMRLRHPCRHRRLSDSIVFACRIHHDPNPLATSLRSALLQRHPLRLPRHRRNRIRYGCRRRRCLRQRYDELERLASVRSSVPNAEHPLQRMRNSSERQLRVQQWSSERGARCLRAKFL